MSYDRGKPPELCDGCKANEECLYRSSRFGTCEEQVGFWNDGHRAGRLEVLTDGLMLVDSSGKIDGVAFARLARSESKP